jgi:hypothetical protein
LLIAPNEPKVGRDHRTNQPTTIREIATSEPATARQNSTNKPTGGCRNLDPISDHFRSSPFLCLSAPG